MWLLNIAMHYNFLMRSFSKLYRHLFSLRSLFTPSIPFLESSVFGMSHLLHIVTHPWSFRLVSCFFFVFLYSFCNNFSSKTYYNVHQIGFFLSFIFQQPGIPYIYHLSSLGGPVSLRLESFLNTLSLPTSVTCSIVPQLQVLVGTCFWPVFLIISVALFR